MIFPGALAGISSILGLSEKAGGLGLSASAIGITNFNFGMSARRDITNGSSIPHQRLLAADSSLFYRGGVFIIITILAYKLQR